LVDAAEELVGAAFRALEASAVKTPAAPTPSLAAARETVGQELARLLADPKVLAALLSPSGGAGESARGGAATLLGDRLEPALARALGAHWPASVRAQVAELLAFARLSPRLAQAVLETLLGERAALARELPRAAASAMLASTGSAVEFKTWLAALADGPEAGPERAAARAALESLEAEPFVALARSQLSEGAHLAFALSDGRGFVDARLVHRRAQEREGDGAQSATPSERAVLGLEFSRTGPLRAEFVLEPQALRVRLSVASEAVAQHLNGTLEALRAPLEALGRSVQLQVAVCPRDSLRVPGPEADALLGDGSHAVDVVA
jgi:hypothetical protein